MEVSRPLFFAAIALSIVSAASSAYLAFGRGGPVAPSAAGASSCACDDASLKRELADLKRTVDARREGDVKQLAARVTALESRSGAPAAADPDKPPAEPVPSAAAAPVATYTSFDLPNKAISIRQEEDGALRVSNTDPSMTGKFLHITGRDRDGAPHDISIVVPAPGQ